MADNSLNAPVVISAIGISAASLPAGLSTAYQMYILNQSQDFTNVAGKANEAGQGAYDAQVRNDEQDVTLEDHDVRISANTNAINLIEVRLTTAEGKIIVLRSDVDYLLDEVVDIQAHLVTVDNRLDAVESDISDIQGDYISKSATASQTIQPVSGSLLIGTIPLPTADKIQVLGSENVSVSYKVAGNQVIGPRATGWTAATGTALLGAFNASQAYTVSATYTQAEVTAIATGLIQARQRIKALEDMLRTHGLMN